MDDVLSRLALLSRKQKWEFAPLILFSDIPGAKSAFARLLARVAFCLQFSQDV